MNNYKISFFDFIGAIVTGLLVGYERQLLADSGEYKVNKLFVSMLIASGSYLAAFLLFHRKQLLRMPNWTLISIFGSILCFLNLHFIKYVIDNWSLTDRMDLTRYIGGFIVIVPIYSFIALIIVGTIHFIGRLVAKYTFESDAVKLR